MLSRPLASLLLAFAVAAPAQTLSVVPIGPGYVTGLSADGTAAVGQFADDYQTYRWTFRTGQVGLGRGTWVPLSVAGGIPRISGDGRTIASSMLSDDGTTATSGRWTVDAGWQSITPPLPAGGGVMDSSDSSVYGFSRDAQVITGLFWRPGQPGGSAHGYAWTAGTGMLDMGSSGSSSRIDGANADGSVLVGWDEHPQYGNRRATVWVRGVKAVLEDSDWPSEAGAVNADGTIVVGQAVDPARNLMAAVMWRWNGQAWTRQVLGVLPGTERNGTAYATAVSDDGQTVVGQAWPNWSKPKTKGFIWTAGGGMQEATEFFAARGITVRGLDIFAMPVMTPNARVVAVTGSDSRPPHAIRSVLVRIVSP